jgi:hypothetical protein
MMNEGGGAYQTIRVETPIKIIGAEVAKPSKQISDLDKL